MNILVVDDKKSVRDNISQLLSALGHTVTTAVNGLDGFEKAQVAPFHLYVIDHLMPLMNGVTLIKNLKNIPQCADVSILFMTTQGKASVENLVEFGLFSEVINKPLNEIEFLATIKSLINTSVSKIA